MRRPSGRRSEVPKASELDRIVNFLRTKEPQFKMCFAAKSLLYFCRGALIWSATLLPVCSIGCFLRAADIDWLNAHKDKKIVAVAITPGKITVDGNLNESE